MPVSSALRKKCGHESLKKSLLPLLHDECGQDIVEYALVAALVALAAIAGIAELAAP